MLEYNMSIQRQSNRAHVARRTKNPPPWNSLFHSREQFLLTHNLHLSQMCIFLDGLEESFLQLLKQLTFQNFVFPLSFFFAFLSSKKMISGDLRRTLPPFSYTLWTVYVYIY